ncbi:MAG TPA: hypothetical protein VFE05_24785 [Longimicrobiaceae bacterium]|jgi:hypothetical protein|nr:hypothetical protein [Longimicrobiaceae bacterium]
MGQGAFLSVGNDTSSQVVVDVDHIVCFYEHGEEGSDFKLFTLTPLAPKVMIGPAYVEAKNTPGCAFDRSHFTLRFGGIGEIEVSQQNSEYGIHRTDGPIRSDLKREGDQFRIHIWVE